MARINIEDSLFKDHRFFQLAIKTGSLQNALGAIVWAFIIAQKHFLDESNDRKIPLEEWKKQECSDLLIEMGLAEMSDSGVSVSGSKEQFSWLLQRVEAGRIGGLSGRAINAKLSEEEKIKREKARKKIGNAIQRGRLQKPKHCEHCGKECLTEAHHSDYDKPFDVSWVCKKCHHIIHDSLVDHEDEQDKRSLTSVKRVEAVAKPLNSLLLSPSLTTNSLSNTIGAEPKIGPLPVVIKILPGKEIEVSSDLVSSWADTYSKEYLHDSMKKMRNWLLANQHKAPKSHWARFVNSWLARDWERYRTTLKSNKPNSISLEELNNLMGQL